MKRISVLVLVLAATTLVAAQQTMPREQAVRTIAAQHGLTLDVRVDMAKMPAVEYDFADMTYPQALSEALGSFGKWYEDPVGSKRVYIVNFAQYAQWRKEKPPQQPRYSTNTTQTQPPPPPPTRQPPQVPVSPQPNMAPTVPVGSVYGSQPAGDGYRSNPCVNNGAWDWWRACSVSNGSGVGLVNVQPPMYVYTPGSPYGNVAGYNSLGYYPSSYYGGMYNAMWLLEAYRTFGITEVYGSFSIDFKKLELDGLSRRDRRDRNRVEENWRKTMILYVDNRRVGDASNAFRKWQGEIPVGEGNHEVALVSYLNPSAPKVRRFVVGFESKAVNKAIGQNRIKIGVWQDLYSDGASGLEDWVEPIASPTTTSTRTP